MEKKKEITALKQSFTCSSSSDLPVTPCNASLAVMVASVGAMVVVTIGVGDDVGAIEKNAVPTEFQR